MMEATSLKSYHEALEEGLINRRQMQVIEYLTMRARDEGVSQTEVNRFFDDKYSSYHPRFKELEDSEVIECVGTKMDPYTGRTVKTYKLTGRVPKTKVEAKPRLITCPYCTGRFTLSREKGKKNG